jgi:DNA-binding SARP family transcriptional activator
MAPVPRLQNSGVWSELMSLRLQLLGEPRLLMSEHVPRVVALERRTGACLALLAVRGPMSRRRLADLLWPAAPEATGRANLRQLLHRLRRLAGGVDLVGGGDQVALVAGVDADACVLVRAMSTQDWSVVAAASASLLASVTLHDCPELDDWLDLTRRRLDWARAHGLDLESARLEVGCPLEAIPLVLRWLEIDPASEIAYRRLMRIHHARGERGAALQVFEVCARALRVHLQASPSAETRRVVHAIRAGATQASAEHPISVGLPLTLRRSRP